MLVDRTAGLGDGERLTVGTHHSLVANETDEGIATFTATFSKNNYSIEDFLRLSRRPRPRLGQFFDQRTHLESVEDSQAVWIDEPQAHRTAVRERWAESNYVIFSVVDLVNGTTVFVLQPADHRGSPGNIEIIRSPCAMSV